MSPFIHICTHLFLILIHNKCPHSLAKNIQHGQSRVGFWPTFKCVHETKTPQKMTTLPNCIDCISLDTLTQWRKKGGKTLASCLGSGGCPPSWQDWPRYAPTMSTAQALLSFFRHIYSYHVVLHREDMYDLLSTAHTCTITSFWYVWDAHASAFWNFADWSLPGPVLSFFFLQIIYG